VGVDPKNYLIENLQRYFQNANRSCEDSVFQSGAHPGGLFGCNGRRLSASGAQH